MEKLTFEINGELEKRLRRQLCRKVIAEMKELIEGQDSGRIKEMPRGELLEEIDDWIIKLGG